MCIGKYHRTWFIYMYVFSEAHVLMGCLTTIRDATCNVKLPAYLKWVYIDTLYLKAYTVICVTWSGHIKY